ncbi:MAG: YraN family protein [Actinomycetota bacterium]|uniref:YraN family protein n=1 Tax=Micrococcaceae TaxID=1268 RepID=UPI0024BA438E|nr:YraN family protein [Paenarthrobacter sp. PH39-S1]MDJ0357589.1 YraN family protein [Paenarthrobacter sp. PH39-S1]MDQ6740102.1 YraN family protein [Actinomycetota bacterium]
MKAKDVLGRRGEVLAADYLEDRGIRVIDQNWRCRSGEIDLVAFDGTCLVIAEVKTRRSLRYGHPFEAITPAKLNRLRTLAVLWSRDHGVFPPSIRIDAVAVLDDGVAEPVLEYLKGVG